MLGAAAGNKVELAFALELTGATGAPARAGLPALEVPTMLLDALGRMVELAPPPPEPWQPRPNSVIAIVAGTNECIAYAFRVRYRTVFCHDVAFRFSSGSVRGWISV